MSEVLPLYKHDDVLVSDESRAAAVRISKIQDGEARDLVMLYDNASLPDNWNAKHKNAEVAQRLASLLGGKVFKLDAMGEARNPFGFPFDPITYGNAYSLGLTNNGDLYGGAVRYLEQADKAVLHPLVTPESLRPEWHDESFATACIGTAIPGFSAFSEKDAELAFIRLADEFGPRVRIKNPSEAMGIGQHVVTNTQGLVEVLARMQDTHTNGVVLEPDLYDPINRPIGFIFFQGHHYSWSGVSKHDFKNGAVIYDNNQIRFWRGMAADMTPSDTETELAVKQAATVHTVYQTIGHAALSRSSYDVVQGETANGEFVSGVTDPSLRPTASSPAEVVALQKLYDDSTLREVAVDMRYLYNPSTYKDEEIYRNNLFSESKQTAITAAVTSETHYDMSP